MKSEKSNTKKTIKKRIEVKSKTKMGVRDKIRYGGMVSKPIPVSLVSGAERRAARLGLVIRKRKISTEETIGEIPKEIFFFWEGDKMSWMRYMTLYSFRKFNPDWKIILYVNKNTTFKTNPWSNQNVQDFFSYKGDDYFSKILELNIEIIEWDIHDNNLIETDIKISPSQKSNFLKWYKLYETGGIYSDMDILWFKPIDDFYESLVLNDYDTAICQTGYLSIGLLASKKNNPLFKDIFINAFESFNSHSYQTAGVLNIYNLFSEVPQQRVFDEIKRRYPKIKPYNIPMDLVYFLNHTQIQYALENSLSSTDFSNESIGYHWYTGHPAIQNLNNILTEKNYMNHNNTFTTLVKEILR